MPSPFPGMDPFIESQLWEDFHTRFIVEIADAIQPTIQPKYAALVERRVYLERSLRDPRRFYQTDVAVSGDPDQPPLARSSGGAGASGTALLVEPVTLPISMPEAVSERYLQIWKLEDEELVGVVEVLSPANKRPGSSTALEYERKREQVLLSQAHLLEIDLVRGGDRMPMDAPLPPADYYVTLSRAGQRPSSTVWPIPRRAPLPTVPVPLAGGDPDVPLDLQACLDAVYNQAYYGAKLRRSRHVQPELSAEGARWVEEVLAAAQRP